MPERDITFRDVLSGINSDNLKINNPIKVPDNQFHELLDMVIERSSLEKIGQRDKFYLNEEKPALDITWLRIVRLPVSPYNVSDYNMFDRWQGVLSSMHEWGYRFYFLLQRKNGETCIYLGVRSQNEFFDANDALEQVEEATSGSMPGIELKKLDGRERAALKMNLDQCNSIGAVTGLPSFFEENKPGVLQTLDPLAFGIRGKDGVERDYSLLIIGDPINDSDTTDIMNRMRTLGSEIHTFVERSVNEGSSKSETKQKGLGAGAGTIMGGIGSSVANLASGIAKTALPIAGPLIGLAFSAVGGVMASTSKSIAESASLSVTTAYLDKFAQYAEQLTDIHVERMKEGRNLGFWNVGIYVLGKDRLSIPAGTPMLSRYAFTFSKATPALWR